MYIRFLIIQLFFLLPLAGIPITLEFAAAPNEISWGLMGRKSLPLDHGMIFIFPDNSKASVWMFNCYMDLSVAFLDKDFTIVELHEMKAYPEKMDPRRPVKNLYDLRLYPNNDPIVRFFRQNAVFSKGPIKYMVEMPKGWFPKHGVRIGDKIYWNKTANTGEVVAKS